MAVVFWKISLVLPFADGTTSMVRFYTPLREAAISMHRSTADSSSTSSPTPQHMGASCIAPSALTLRFQQTHKEPANEI